MRLFRPLRGKMLGEGLAWWEEYGEEQLVWKTENAGGETGGVDADAGGGEGEFRLCG